MKFWLCWNSCEFFRDDGSLRCFSSAGKRFIHEPIVLEGENQLPFPLRDSEVVSDAVQLALGYNDFYRGLG
jgi:hypothetical protein